VILLNRWLSKLQTERFIGTTIADKYLEEFIVSVCFEILKPVSDYIIINSSRTNKSIFFAKCDRIILLVEESVYKSRRSKTFEDFKTEVLLMPNKVQELLNITLQAHEDIDSTKSKDKEAIEELIDSLQWIYAKYFDKTKEKKTRKRRSDAGKQRIIPIKKRNS
jgi:hypothetical protein